MFFTKNHVFDLWMPSEGQDTLFWVSKPSIEALQSLADPPPQTMHVLGGVFGAPARISIGIPTRIRACPGGAPGFELFLDPFSTFADNSVEGVWGQKTGLRGLATLF